MSAKIQLRRDTLTEWLKVDPVLADGEEVLVAADDTRPKNYTYKKLGDGTSRFSELPELYLSAYDGGGGSEEPTDTYVKDIRLRVVNGFLQVVGKDVLPTDEVEVYRLFSRRVNHKYSDKGQGIVKGYRKLSASGYNNYLVMGVSLVEEALGIYRVFIVFNSAVLTGNAPIPKCFEPLIFKTDMGMARLVGFKIQKTLSKQHSETKTHCSMSRWGIRLLRNGKPITGIMPFRIFCITACYRNNIKVSLRCSM